MFILNSCLTATNMTQNINLESCEYASSSRAGVQANFSIGGGPHIKTTTSSPGGGSLSLIICALTKPSLYVQSEADKTIILALIWKCIKDGQR